MLFVDLCFHQHDGIFPHFLGALCFLPGFRRCDERSGFDSAVWHPRHSVTFAANTPCFLAHDSFAAKHSPAWRPRRAAGFPHVPACSLLGLGGAIAPAPAAAFGRGPRRCVRLGIRDPELPTPDRHTWHPPGHSVPQQITQMTIPTTLGFCQAQNEARRENSERGIPKDHGWRMNAEG